MLNGPADFTDDGLVTPLNLILKLVLDGMLTMSLMVSVLLDRLHMAVELLLLMIARMHSLLVYV